MGIRQDLAAHLKAEIVDTGIVVASELAVYDAGVDIVSVPCLVINPADPYEAVVTMKQEAVQVNMLIHLVSNRNDPESAFTYLEDLRLATTRAMRTMTPSFRWVTHGAFGATEVGGVAYATSVLEVVTTMRDRSA